MTKRRNRMRRIQAVAAGTLTMSMMMVAALPAAAAEASAGTSAFAQTGEAAAVPAAAQQAEPKVTEDTVRIGREEAEARMKKLFPVLKEARLDQVGLGSDSYPPSSEAVWNLQWSVTSPDGRSSYGFSTEMDAMTGDVLSMHVPDALLGEPAYYPPKLSREEALKVAEALIKKAIPSLKGTALKESDEAAYGGRALFGPFQYYFVFETEHNGIPVPFQGVHVNVDGNGNLTHLNYRPLPDGLPEAAEPIAKEQALAAYEKRLELQLAYVNANMYRGASKWVLAWMPAPSHSGVMDAITGEWLGFDGTPIAEGDATIPYARIAPSEASVFTPEKPEGETITGKRAEEIVAAAYRLPDGSVLGQQAIQEDFNSGRSVWRLAWRQGGPTPFGFPNGISATVDAANGQIYEIRKEMYPPNFQPPGQEQEQGKAISDAEAQRKADELVAKLYPNAKETLKRLEGTPPGEPTNPSSDHHLFVYQPFLNGYPLQDYGVRVQLSKDGQLESYYVSGGRPAPDVSELPKAPAVEQARAERAWLERSDLVLRYEQFGGYYMNDGQQVKETMKLTYRHEWKSREAASIFDAVSGEWIELGYAAPTPSGKPAQPVDLEGHAAEKDLLTLAEFGVLDVDDESRANPNAVITRERWALWLAAAVDPYFLNTGYYGAEEKEEPYYSDVAADGTLHKALRMLEQLQWLEVRKKGAAAYRPDEALTREDIAVWAAHVLRYDRLAELLRNDPEVSALSDYERIAHPGAAALAVKLELLPVANGAWSPDQYVTRAEAASLLMKLVRLQAAVDQQLHFR